MALLRYFSIIALMTLLTWTSQGQSIEADIDRLLTATYHADRPGATAIITKGGEPIYRKAFGLANLELEVPMKPEHVFEIGSITKQFTAVSILMLMEEGKLGLEDEITKYLPDYPTHGHTITIHHLLNHTSGIKSYTGMQSFQSQARTDMTPMQLIDVFKDEPMDFDPGDEYLYNNSAFIILGHIIEEVTGETYEDFVEKRLLKPAGMTSSCYGHKDEVIKNRASGYQPGQFGYKNADYLSMTLPYAAGSLMSTVDDLAKWQEAINDNKFITEESKQLAWSNYTLNNGDKINYGYGWGPNDVNGSASIEHGGGIFGYQTMGIYIPSEDVYVALLTNSNGTNPTDVAVKMAAIAVGHPYPDNSSVASLSHAQLEKWVGAYEFEDGAVRFISLKDGQLISQRENSNEFKIYPSSPNTFFFDQGLISYTFSEGPAGKQAVFQDRIVVSKGEESNKKPARPKEAIELSSKALAQYKGKFELMPNFIIEVTPRDGQIFAQATGQPEFEMFAEKEDHFFLKVVPASIVFKKDGDGNVESLTLFQGGQEMLGKKME